MMKKTIIALTLMLGASVAQAEPIGFYWTNGWNGAATGTVNRVNYDGTGATLIATGYYTVGDVEVDQANGNVYWNNWVRPSAGFRGHPSEGIYRSGLDGSGAVQFTGVAESNATNGFASGHHGISLDVGGETVYFTRGVSYADGNGPEISRINYDGTGYTQLNGPGRDGWFLNGVAVDPANERVFWGSPGVISGALDGAVNVVNTDGTSPSQVVPHTNGEGRAIAYDPVTDTIFFTSYTIFDPSTGGGIWSVNPDGSGLTNLGIAGLTGVTDIEVDSAAGRIYWTNFAAGTIESALFDGSDHLIVLTGLDDPYGLALEFDEVAVPEPASLAIWSAFGAIGFAAARRRKKKT